MPKTNGFLENIGGDYNLDGVANDHSTSWGYGAAYSANNPTDGIFTDNHKIGCGYAGAQLTQSAEQEPVPGGSVKRAQSSQFRRH